MSHLPVANGTELSCYSLSRTHSPEAYGLLIPVFHPSRNVLPGVSIGPVEPKANKPFGLLAYVQLVNVLMHIRDAEDLALRDSNEVGPDPDDYRIKIAEDHLAVWVAD